MKTIYLHIGTPKTGTTHLQHYLSHNKARLHQDGLHYVADSQGVSALGIAVAMGFWEDHDPDAHVEDMAWFRAEMRAAMASSADSILLSSEMFCETTASRRMTLIRRLHAELTAFGADRIVVVCYLRRQDLFIESRHANDIIHWGIDPPVSDADPEVVAYADYYKLLSDYRVVFGDNLIVRPYEKSQLLNADILDDFLDQLGLLRRPEYCLPTGEEQNVRIRGDLTEMLRLYNLSGLGEARPYSFIRARFLPDLFTPEQRGRGPGRRFLSLGRRKRVEILKRYSVSNKKVAVEFLGRKDGKLFRDGVAPEPSHWRKGTGLQVEEITPLFMHMITELFDQTGPLPARIDTIEAQSTHAVDRIAVIESRLKSAEDRCGHLDSQLRNTQDRCGHLESQLHSAQDRYSQLELQSREAQAQTRDAQDRCTHLDSQSRDAQAQAHNAQDRCAQLEIARRDLQWRLACLSSAGKKLIGWGTTVAFRENHFKNPVPLAYLVDNDSARWGEKLKGIPVQYPGKLEREIPSDVIIIVYSTFFDEIAAQIARIGHFTVIPADVFTTYAPLTQNATRGVPDPYLQAI